MTLPLFLGGNSFCKSDIIMAKIQGSLAGLWRVPPTAPQCIQCKTLKKNRNFGNLTHRSHLSRTSPHSVHTLKTNVGSIRDMGTERRALCSRVPYYSRFSNLVTTPFLNSNHHLLFSFRFDALSRGISVPKQQ